MSQVIVNIVAFCEARLSDAAERFTDSLTCPKAKLCGDGSGSLVAGSYHFFENAYSSD